MGKEYTGGQIAISASVSLKSTFISLHLISFPLNSMRSDTFRDSESSVSSLRTKASFLLRQKMASYYLCNFRDSDIKLFFHQTRINGSHFQYCTTIENRVLTTLFF